MSADNWTMCPRCAVTLDAALAVRRRQLHESASAMPLAEFIAATKNLTAAEESGLPDDFREDYEIGVDSDSLHVSYRGSCSRCSFAVKHDQEIPIDVGLTP